MVAVGWGERNAPKLRRSETKGISEYDCVAGTREPKEKENCRVGKRRG